VSQALDISSVDFMSAIGSIVPFTMINRLIGFHDSDIDHIDSARPARHMLPQPCRSPTAGGSRQLRAPGA